VEHVERFDARLQAWRGMLSASVHTPRSLTLSMPP